MEKDTYTFYANQVSAKFYVLWYESTVNCQEHMPSTLCWFQFNDFYGCPEGAD